MRTRNRSTWIDVGSFMLLTAAAVWLLARGTGNLNYNWQWYRVGEFLFTRSADGWHPGLLLRGLWVTLQITAVSLLLAMVFGLSTALLRLSASPLGRLLARGYLEGIRNTPLIVQMFFIYFVLGPVLDIDAFAAGVLALSLFEGAYASEIFRAGIVSVHRGQWEAAESIGLDRRKIYRLVILPQAIRRILPPLTGQAIALVKDSALVSTIAIYDLTMRGQAIVAETYMVFEIWFVVAAIYLLLTLTLSLLVNVMELRLRLTD